MGRKTDQILIDVLDAGTSIANNVNSSATGMTLIKAKNMQNIFGSNDVPDDGQRYWAVGPAQWGDLMSIDQFSRAEYVGTENLPFTNGESTAKRWMGFMWFVHSGLSKVSSDRYTLAWHKSSTGLGIGQDVKTEVNYIPEKVSNLVTSSLSMGAVAIDGDAIRRQLCAE